jgi:hypothetical protein
MHGEEPQEVQDGDPSLMEVPRDWLSAKDCFSAIRTEISEKGSR